MHSQIYCLIVAMSKNVDLLFPLAEPLKDF